MSEAERRPRIRRRRWLIVGIALLLVLAAVSLECLRRYRNEQALVADIQRAGGDVYLGQSLPRLLQSLLKGHGAADTYVFLKGPAFDGQWLRSHNHLTDLPVESLVLQDTAIPGTELAALIDAQPLKSFDAEGIEFSPAAIDALAKKSALEGLALAKSSLTDGDLRQLRLEGVEQIQVAATQVTSAGILELARCRRLRALGLDSSQLNVEVVDFIRRTPSLRLIVLDGEDVTDDHLHRIQDIPTLKVFFLRDTSVSQATVDELLKARPGIQVELQTSD
jgi:hypothetical protein